MISIDEINKLKEENAKLNAIIDSYQPRLQALKDENKQLKELFEIESLTDIKTGETMYRSRQIIHFVDILQEIKEIMQKICNNCVNIDGFTLLDECENYCAYKEFPRLWQIINKAEEE